MWALECQYELPPPGEEFTLRKLCFAALRRDPAKMTAGNQPPLGLLSVLGVSLKNKVLVGITPPVLLACVQCRPESSASANGTGASCVRVAEEKAAQSCTPGTVRCVLGENFEWWPLRAHFVWCPGRRPS